MTVSESPEERWSRLGQLALNIAPVVLPVLGRLVPRKRPAQAQAPAPNRPAPVARRRRRPFFNRWRLFRLGALAAGMLYLFRSRLIRMPRRWFHARVS